MSSIFALKNVSVTIETGHLWQRRKKVILQDVSFSLAEGESVAYLGPNGAGKTTTFRAICGLSTQISGQFFWKDKEVTPEQLHQQVGFLPEAAYFYRTLTPMELLVSLGKLSGLSESKSKKRVYDWAERLDFTNVLEQSIGTCSKGQLQRVGLAQALLHDPELLILDEPMSGLDPIGRDLVRKTLQAVNAEGTTLLFSSHILTDAESLCHKVVALHEGGVIYNGSLEGLLAEEGAWSICIKCDHAGASMLEGTTCQSEVDGSFTVSGDGGQTTFQDNMRALLDMAGVHVIAGSMKRPRLEEAFVKLVHSRDEAKDV